MNTQKLIQLYEELSKTNDKMLKQYGDGITPMCFIISKDFSISIIGMIFKNNEEKLKMRYALMKIISSQQIFGYILMIDTKMTFKDKDKAIVQDAVMRTLYTPKGVLKRQVVIHKGKNIIETKDLSKEMANMTDEFNYWGKHFDFTDEKDKEINEWYQDFKEKNPELYKGV